jgi:DNA gyrase subunit A
VKFKQRPSLLCSCVALQGLERETIENELNELLKPIKRYEEILADEQEILAIIKTELLEMKERYGDERRSQIINHELGKFSDEELIPEEETVVLLTTENYIKRTLVSEYRRQHRGGKGKRGMTTKEEDVIDQLCLQVLMTGYCSLPTRDEYSV